MQSGTNLVNNQGFAGSRERGGERGKERHRENIARVSNPISPVHGVCACVCLRIYMCVCALPLWTVKKQPGIKAWKHLGLCSWNNDKPSLTEASSNSESVWAALSLPLPHHACPGFCFVPVSVTYRCRCLKRLCLQCIAVIAKRKQTPSSLRPAIMLLLVCPGGSGRRRRWRWHWKSYYANEKLIKHFK